MTRTHRIQDSLATIGALFADYHQRHFAPTGQSNRDTTIGYIRYHSATPLQTSLGVFDAVAHTQMSAHQQVQKAQAEDTMRAHTRDLVAQFSDIPLLAHPGFTLGINIHHPYDSPQVFLRVDGLPLTKTHHTPAILAQTLAPRLDQLARLSAMGPFHTFDIGGHTVHAPDAASAIFKWGLLTQADFDPRDPAKNLPKIIQIIRPETIAANLGARAQALRRQQERP